MNKKTILIFDDDPNVLEVFKIVLEDLGYQVRQSATSHDVLEKVGQFEPDLILMDNWIPEIGGILATQMLKAHHEYSKIPVILVSANSDIAKLAKQAGANSYLPKPFDLDKLEECVSKFLQSEGSDFP